MVKTFVADHQALDEAKNMNFLKHSLTNNWSIAVHDAIIGSDEHDHIRISIVLPWASLGNLSQFLMDGIDNTHQGGAEHYYNFAEKFPRVKNDQQLVHSLLGQSTQLAGALKFLHEGFDTKQDDWYVRCTHLDLKPSNILIFHSPNSIVGKWKISDFGISVLDARQKAGHSQKTGEMGSLGNYFTRIQEKFRPPVERHLETYQAPEAEFPLDFLTVKDVKDAKQKSCIWSFGAILVEVLAYASGRSEGVREFRQKRSRQDSMGGRPDDLFYERMLVGDPSHGLLRGEVSYWLDGFRYNIPHPSTCCLKCWAIVVKRILVSDVRNRPDARHVESWLQQLQDHITYPAQQPCLESHATIPPHFIHMPSNLQSPYFKRHLSRQLSPVYDEPYPPAQSEYGRPRSTENPSLMIGSQTDITYETEPSINDDDQPSPLRVDPAASTKLSARRSSGTTSSSGIRDGLTILTTTRSSESSHISLASTDVIDYDLDAAGGKLAYLTKSGVEIFKFTTAEPARPQNHGLVSIDGKKQDYRIRVSGQYLVVWGYIDKQVKASGQRLIW